MKIFLTGGTGFLGSHFAELATAQGHEVRCLVRKTSNTKFLDTLPNIEKVYANLERGEGLEACVEGVDAVVHSAGLVKAAQPDDFYKVNGLGTVHLLDAVKAANPKLKRFLYISSLVAHGFSQDGKPRAADAAANPVSHYGKSKLAGEKAALACKGDIPVTVLRPPAIYGPRDGEMFAFFQMVSKRVMPFMGSKENKLSLIYGPDCAQAMLDLCKKKHASGSVYFVDDGHVYSQGEFGETVARALGVKAFPISIPIGVVSVAARGSELYSRISKKAVMLTSEKVKELREPYLICSGDTLREDLGWEPSVTLEEGARITADWYKQEGWL